MTVPLALPADATTECAPPDPQYQEQQKLTGFDPAKISQLGRTKAQEIALLVFVAVNDSSMADRINKDLRANVDFACWQDTATSVLHCRALPNALTFLQYQDGPVRIRVNRIAEGPHGTITSPADT